MSRSLVLSWFFAVALVACGGGAASGGGSSSTGGGAGHPTLARWRDETVGPLRLGMTEADLVSALGEPPSRGDYREMEATGESLAQWAWPALGVEVTMIQGEGGGRAASISLSGASSFITGRGIALGSTYEAVVEAYADVPIEADDEPRTDPADHGFVRLGNAYEALSFRLENERVTSILLGSTGAE